MGALVTAESEEQILVGTNVLSFLNYDDQTVFTKAVRVPKRPSTQYGLHRAYGLEQAINGVLSDTSLDWIVSEKSPS